MAKGSRPATKKVQAGKSYRPLTVGSIEKESGYKSNIPQKNMKVSTYFKNQGFAPLGKALEKIEHNLAK